MEAGGAGAYVGAGSGDCPRGRASGTGWGAEDDHGGGEDEGGGGEEGEAWGDPCRQDAPERC